MRTINAGCSLISLSREKRCCAGFRCFTVPNYARQDLPLCAYLMLLPIIIMIILQGMIGTLDNAFALFKQESGYLSAKRKVSASTVQGEILCQISVYKAWPKCSYTTRWVAKREIGWRSGQSQ